MAFVTVIVFWRQQSELLQDLGSAREAAGAARADVASTATSLERRLEERLSGQEARLREVEPVVGTLEQRVADLRDTQARLADRLAAQDDRLDAAEQGVARNEQALADAGGVLRDARDRWVIAEVEYLMQTANTALQLARDPRTALAALEAADDHLGTLANPRLTATRETLAGEITALRAMPLPDVNGIAVRLASLAAAADTLPLVEDRVVNYPLEGGDPDAPPGWERAWSALKGAVSSLVSFRRDDAQVVPLLEPDERFFLHRNLELLITAARVAALNGDAVNYRLSLEAARRTLDAGFDGDADAVASMGAQLDELLAVNIAPEAPDIGGSLLALREAAARMR
jgi:uroporphyrin-3 C-methyltransferase